jgi:hypothetical protein
MPKAHLVWKRAVRIIRSLHPPIDLFEDIADPADWPLLMSGEQKTNPRLMETLGNLDLVPRGRRVGGAGASYLMAPFTHVSPDRPTRFSAGAFGVLYVAESFETALFETMHHHALFMVATGQKPGWTSQFREILLDVDATLHDLRGLAGDDPVLAPDDYDDGQALGAALRSGGADGVVYPSVRHPGGACAGLFYPDGAASATQGRHLDYHFDGVRVDFYRDAGANQVFRVL